MQLTPIGFSSEPSGLRAAVRQCATSYNAQSSSELTVKTAEGDTIRISLNRQVKECYTDYRFLLKTGFGKARVQERVQSSAVSAQLEIGVEGDLSEQELSDLSRLMQGLGNSSGQQARDAPAGFIQNLSSLAGFDYWYTGSVTYQMSEQSERVRL